MESMWSQALFCLMLMAFVTKGIFCCQEPAPSQGSPIQVKETDPAGKLLFTMTSPDALSWRISVDSTSSVSSSALTPYFQIQRDTTDPSHWSAHLTRPLDIEGIQQDLGFLVQIVELNLMCTDRHSSRKINFTRYVIVEEVSEFPPYFSPSQPVFEIYEDSEVGQNLFDISTVIKDRDVLNGANTGTTSLDLNAVLVTPCTQLQPGVIDAFGFFNVSTSWRVFLLTKVDYEIGQTLFAMNVTAVDSGGLTGTAIVTIKVLNVNDNPPSFQYIGCTRNCDTLTYQAYIEPTFTGVVTTDEPGAMMVSDLDTDSLTITILSGYPEDFTIYVSVDPSTGDIRVDKALEDTDISLIFLYLEASDRNSTNSVSRTNSQIHKTQASVYLQVVGRGTVYKSTGSRTTNGSNSDNNDERIFFIATIALSSFLFIALLVVIVLAVAYKKRKPPTSRVYLDYSQNSIGRLQTIPNIPISARHQSVASDHSKSGTVNRGMEEDNDRVFVTDAATYYDLETFPRSRLNHISNDAFQNQLIPLDAAITTTDGSNPGVRGDEAEARVSQRPPTLQEQAALESQYRALDLLTSVAPLEKKSKGSKNKILNGDLMDTASSVGTVRSLKDVDVISELEEIVANQRLTHRDSPTLGESATLSKPGQYIANENDEGITSFLGEGISTEPQLVPLDAALMSADFASGSTSSPFRSQTHNPDSKTNSELSLWLTEGFSPLYPISQCMDFNGNDSGKVSYEPSVNRNGESKIKVTSGNLSQPTHQDAQKESITVYL